MKRVVKLAEELAEQGVRPLFTHGPLIHNQAVIQWLAEKGVRSLPADVTDEHLAGIPAGAKVIIRAHGVPARELRRLADARVEVVDGTCPHVVNIQKEVEAAYKAGRSVVVLGDKGHAEIVGLMGYCPGSGFVVSCDADVEALTPGKPVTVVAQSTLDEGTFRHLTALVRDKCRDTQVVDTRCDATLRRQQEAMELCRQADAMVVIGGKNSANTNRLAEICRGQDVPTFHVEDAAELQDRDFAGVDVVGVTAGASTPDWIIKDVMARLLAM